MNKATAPTFTAKEFASIVGLSDRAVRDRLRGVPHRFKNVRGQQTPA